MLFNIFSGLPLSLLPGNFSQVEQVYSDGTDLTQEGFRFRYDDDSESTATWLAPQDTNITRDIDQNTRLRVIVDASATPAAEEYQLEYKISTASAYRQVAPVGGFTPTVETVSTGSSGAVDTTSHTITMPSGIVEGDLLILVFSSDGAPGTGSTGEMRIDSGNWIRLGYTSYNTDTSGGVFYKFAEGGDTATVTTTSAEQSTHVVYRVSGAGVPRAVAATGSSTNSDPPDLDTTTARSDLWIATRSGDDQVVATSAPTGYSNLQTVTADGSGGASTNTAIKAANVASEDPGTFTSATEQWVSFTISIPPFSMGLDGIAVPTNTGSASFSAPYPLDIQAGDLLVLAIANKYPPNDPDTPTGWTLVSGAQNSGGSGPTSTDDSGEVFATIFTKEADGTETGSLSVTLPSNNSASVRMMSFRKEDDTTWDLTATGGSDTTVGTDWSVTGGSDIDIQAGDIVLVASAINTDGNRYTNQSLSATGVTFGWHNQLLEQSTGNGNDTTLSVSQHGAIGGTSSAAPVFTQTSSGTAANAPAGASSMLRIRQVGPGSSYAPIVLAPSANITASGENTTAQLTAPAGKTTSDFTVGRIQDDENPADAVTIGTTDYTELEWSLSATGYANTNDVFQFRVTANGSVLETYAVTPEWTIGTPPQPTFSLAAYRWYLDNDSENVTDPWGNPDLAANAQIALVPYPLNTPPTSGTELRLRVGITVNTDPLSATSQQFKLQYKTGTDASCTSGSWSDVDAAGSGGIWRFATSGVTDGTTLTNIRLTSTSDVLQVYAKANPTATNPNSATAGQDIEYDFHLQHNAAADATTYSFRVVESDDTVFDAYTVCPTLMTAPGTAQLMRHGEVFAEQTERGKTWAN